MRRIRAPHVSSPWLLFAAALAAGCSRGPRGHGEGDDATRVQRVLTGLRPQIAIKGASPIRWTLAGQMAAHHVPGVSIAVIDSGRIVWAKGFGVKEDGTADSVTPATLFQAASI